MILQSFSQKNCWLKKPKKKKNPEILTNKPLYLILSTLELSKILMHKFWYNYVKPKYGEKVSLYT